MPVVSARPEFRGTRANAVTTNRQLNPYFRSITLFKGKKSFCAVWKKRSQREINGDDLRNKTKSHM